jgi:hypothetical protein
MPRLQMTCSLRSFSCLLACAVSAHSNGSYIHVPLCVYCALCHALGQEQRHRSLLHGLCPDVRSWTTRLEEIQMISTLGMCVGNSMNAVDVCANIFETVCFLAPWQRLSMKTFISLSTTWMVPSGLTSYVHACRSRMGRRQPRERTRPNKVGCFRRLEVQSSVCLHNDKCRSLKSVDNVRSKFLD